MVISDLFPFCWVRILLFLYFNRADMLASPANALYEHAQAMLLDCISQLCQGNPLNQKRFRDKEGVVTLFLFLKYNPTDPSHEDELVISAVDCLWSAAVGIAENERPFLDAQGSCN